MASFKTLLVLCLAVLAVALAIEETRQKRGFGGYKSGGSGFSGLGGYKYGGGNGFSGLGGGYSGFGYSGISQGFGFSNGFGGLGGFFG